MEVINEQAQAMLLNLQQGLHLAMSALIEEEDAEEAEGYLRQVDQRLTAFINRAKVVRLSSRQLGG